MTTDDAGTVPEAGSGPAQAVPAPDQESRQPKRWRAVRRTQDPAGPKRWRAWRRSRPFWGGLLLILSGLELFALPLSGVLVHGAIKLVIYIGIGGVFGVLIGVLLIVAGLLIWLNPVHRTFFGITGIVLGIASFPASNLGGFLLGMLLAIIGGSLAFAWTPTEPNPEPLSAPGAAAPADDVAPADQAASEESTQLPAADSEAALS